MTDHNNEIAERNRVKGATELAIKKARMYGTKLAVLRNGRVEYLSPDTCQARIAQNNRDRGPGTQ